MPECLGSYPSSDLGDGDLHGSDPPRVSWSGPDKCLGDEETPPIWRNSEVDTTPW